MPYSSQPGPVKNVLFIMVDQLRWDYLGCTGHPSLQTPNLDQRAGRGGLFDLTYVQSPICGPSRMSYYTGRYVSSHRSTWLMVPLPLSERTMGDYLRENGRNLSLIGKSHFLPDRNSIERLGGLSDPDRSEYAMEGGFENIARDDGILAAGQSKRNMPNICAPTATTAQTHGMTLRILLKARTEKFYRGGT